jgi:molybdenum cofactor biosynthesis protein B
MSFHDHKSLQNRSISVAVITISDTRTKDTDKSGLKMKELLTEEGHQVLFEAIVPDEKESIREVLKKAVANVGIQVVLLNGGTGIAKRDVTIETVSPLFEKEMPGFGELFRLLSYNEDIGSASILSRATAGIVNGKVIFITPGSTAAVDLAMRKLILPEINHVVRELEK